MSNLSESLALPAPSRWRLPAMMTAGVLLLLVGVFWPTVHSMIAIWARSDTFAHGFVILPISLWLIWRERAELARITPQPDVRGLLVIVAAGAGWLLGEAGSVNVVEQFAFVAMLIGMVWALLGWAFVWSAFFPLMFLFFAVPVGEFLIPYLVEYTADFTVAALQLTGVPVYREGSHFSIPSGDWSVIEECSGIRYLIASVTLGALYAYLTFRSWRRRLLFTLAALAVPILANGGRAYMIVMLAHLSDMKLATGVDHYLYGWVFFGVVMLLLFWVGSFWREDGQPQIAHADRAERDARPAWPFVLAALALAGLWPAYAAWLEARPLPPLPELHVETRGGWEAGEGFTSWAPHWTGADRHLRQSYAKSGSAVMLELNYYATQRQDAELVNSQNIMIEREHPVWSNVGEGLATVTVGGESRQVRQAKLKSRDGQRLLVWQWNLIGSHATVDDRRAKLVLALDRVRMRRDDGMSVLVATPYEDTDIDAAKATLARFAADMAPAIGGALDGVDGQ